MKLKALLVSAGLVLVALSDASAAESKRPYVICERTTSPDGRYAVAWSLKKDEGWDWDKLNADGTQFDDMPNMDDVQVEGRIVDLKSGRQLAKFPCTYWVSPSGSRPNHHSLDVEWSEDSQFVVVAHQLRFDTATISALRLKDGAVAGQLDILDSLDGALRQHLKKVYGRQYDRDKGEIVVAFGDLKNWGPGTFRFTAYSGQPKRMSETILQDDSVVTFELTPGAKGKLAMKVVSIKQKVDGADDGYLSTKALADADEALNRAYQSLRNKLNAEQREELKNEQKAWLEQRDAIQSQDEKVGFIQKRTKELGARLKK